MLNGDGAGSTIFRKASTKSYFGCFRVLKAPFSKIKLRVRVRSRRAKLEVHRCAHAGDCILDKHRLKAEDELLSYKMHLVITL